MNLVLEGLEAGAVYALIAVAISWVYRATHLFDFSLAAVGVAGAYATVELLDSGAPESAALVLGVIMGAVLSASLRRLLLPSQLGHSTRTAMSIALLLSLQSMLLLWQRGRPRAMTAEVLDGAGVLLPLAALVVAWGVYNFSGWRASLTALFDRPRLALIWGLPVERLRDTAALGAGAFVSLAAILIANRQGLEPGVLLEPTLVGFAAAAVCAFGRGVALVGLGFGVLISGLNYLVTFDAGQIIVLIVVTAALLRQARRRT